MTVTLAAVLSAGYLEVAAADLPAPRGQPQLALGEVEALVAFCRLEIAKHLQQSDAADSPDARLMLVAAETELLTAMDSIGDACNFIERDVQERAA